MCSYSDTCRIRKSRGKSGHYGAISLSLSKEAGWCQYPVRSGIWSYLPSWQANDLLSYCFMDVIGRHETSESETEIHYA